MFNQLIKLGFSKTEAQIYLILLKEKEAIPGFIIEKYEKDNPLSQAKFLPEEFKSPTATIMGRDRINIQILGGQEIIIIVIVNQKITNGYRKYFDVLWKIARD